MNPGMGNQLIWTNMTLTGTSLHGLNRIITTESYNLNLTNNRITDMVWITEAYGITAVQTYMSCPYMTEFTYIFEGNTFVNSDGRTDAGNPIQVYIDAFNVQSVYKVVFRNNVFIN